MKEETTKEKEEIAKNEKKKEETDIKAETLPPPANIKDILKKKDDTIEFLKNEYGKVAQMYNNLVIEQQKQAFDEGFHKEELMSESLFIEHEKLIEKSLNTALRNHYIFVVIFASLFLICFIL